ncbi:ABC transporter transmembrane domain-containing protein [Oenococcus sp.]|uniref:ABC transporter transmembrane domain-containing protein n=1 Tax=Oenococcus sp. TaxID=1979414 RepID=UPI0039E8C9BA
MNKKDYFLSIIFALLISVDAFVMPQMTRMLTDGLFKRSLHLLILAVLWGLLGQYFVELVGFFWQKYMYRTIWQINTKTKLALLTHFYQSPVGQMKESAASEISFLLNDVKQIENGAVSASINLVHCIFLFLAASGYVFYLNWQIGAVFVLTSLLPLFVPKMFAKKLQSNTKRWSQSNQQTTEQVTDAVHGAETIVSYQAEKAFLRFIKTLVDRTEKYYYHYNFDRVSVNICADLFMIFANLLPVFLGGLLVLNGQLSVGSLLAAFMAAGSITSPLMNAISYYNQIKSTEPIIEHLIQQTTNESDQTLSAQPSLPKMLKLSLQDVTIKQNQRSIFAHLNLTVAAGQKILLIGESGAGKTTLLKTLMGELTPSQGQGQVLVNDQAGLTVDTSQFAYVQQDANLFDLSLRNNLTLFQDFTDTEIEKSLFESQLASILEQRGLDFVIGPKGDKLSGGQRRRVEMARALLHKRNWLIVDEGLGSLDAATAKLLHESMMQLPMTLIDVEHQVPQAWYEDYDQVLELANGQLQIVN